MMHCLHLIFPLHMRLPTVGFGTPGNNNVITTCRTAFHDLNAIIDGMTAGDDRVACRSTARGVHTEEWMGIPQKTID